MEFYGRHKGIWNPETGILTYRQSKPLKPGLEVIKVNTQIAEINIAPALNEAPHVEMYSAVSAASEDAARRQLMRDGLETTMRNRWGRLKIGTDDQIVFDNPDGSWTRVHATEGDVLNGSIMMQKVTESTRVNNAMKGFAVFGGELDGDMGSQVDPARRMCRPAVTRRRIDVFVPGDTPIQYSLNNSFGSIRMQGVSGETDINSETADVVLEDTEGKADIRTEGAITVRAMHGSLHASGDDCLITVTNHRGEAYLRTVMGDIDVHGKEFTGESVVTSDIGAVDVVVEGFGVDFQSEGLSLTITGSKDEISIYKESWDQYEGLHKIRGSMGQVPTGNLTVESEKGMVRIRKMRE